MVLYSHEKKDYLIEFNFVGEDKVRRNYPSIDMEKTGRLLKNKTEIAGYTPKMIQEYLHLSCPQPIYRWFKGIILPSVDHLLLLSELLGVHMENLLVKKQEKKCVLIVECDKNRDNEKQMLIYYNRIRRVA